MRWVHAAINRIGRSRRPTFLGASMALSLWVGLAGCQADPGWPPPNDDSSWGYRAGDEPGGTLSRVSKEMEADSTVIQAMPSIDVIMIHHSQSLSTSLPSYEMGRSTNTAVADTTSLADVAAIYTAALSKAGLTRDSSYDRVVETPIVRFSDYRPDPRETRQPYIRSNLLVWRHVGTWGRGDLTFAVMYDEVFSGYPGRSYRFMSVLEPDRTRP